MNALRANGEYRQPGHHGHRGTLSSERQCNQSIVDAPKKRNKRDASSNPRRCDLEKLFHALPVVVATNRLQNLGTVSLLIFQERIKTLVLVSDHGRLHSLLNRELANKTTVLVRLSPQRLDLIF